MLEAKEDPVSQAQQLLAICVSSHGGCGKVDDAGLDRSSVSCQDSAALCSIQQSLPRRMSELSKGTEVLVIDVQAWLLNGTLSLSEVSRYCTLSCRWGDTAHNCVLKAPFARQISINIESMPQTFRDAIETTRGLGIRFLWIDALCIIQPDACGDDVDWNAEGPRMGSIYHNAVCTISATAALSATCGFLLKTDSERIRAVPCKVTQHMYDGDARTRWLLPFYLIFGNAVTFSALNERGWVTQEQLLSRRILHFTLQGVFWECCRRKMHGHSSVSHVRDYCPLSWNVSSFEFGDGRRWKEWMTFVEHYSGTEFTNPEDRLIALSSLARVVDRNRKYEDSYCAGLWRNSLLDDLLWMRLELPSSDTPKRMSIAPSWSWASLQGEIRYRHFPSASSSVQVLDVHLVPSQCINPYGNIKDGRLKLVAQVATVSISVATANLGTKVDPPFRIEDKANQWYSKLYRSVIWDE